MRGSLQTIVLATTAAVSAFKFDHGVYLPTAVDFYSIRPLLDSVFNGSGDHEALSVASIASVAYNYHDKDMQSKMSTTPTYSLDLMSDNIVIPDSELKTIQDDSINLHVTSLQPETMTPSLEPQTSREADRAMAGISVAAVVLAITMTVIQPVIPLT